MKREFCHTRRGYPPTCYFGGIRLFDIPPFKEISNSATAFYRIHPRLKKPWYSAKADKIEKPDRIVSAGLFYGSQLATSVKPVMPLESAAAFLAF